jgi:hypothetical protein
VTLYATKMAVKTTAWNYVVTVTVSEPVLGLTAANLTIGGTSNAASHWTVDPVVGSGAHYGFSIHHDNPPNGTLTIAIGAGKTNDMAGNQNLASAVKTIYIDRTAPKATAPVVRLRVGGTLGTSEPVTIAWSATDTGGSGVRSYDLARSVNGGAFRAIYVGLASPVVSISLAPGTAYRFEARARDRAGNVGAWVAGPTVRGSVYQNSSGSVVYHGAWATSSASAYSGGSVRYATAAGASASLTTSARSLAFVTTIASTRGYVWIYIDGKYRSTISLAGATAYRRIVYSASWTSIGTHSIKIVVVGTAGHPRVDLDAFEVVR